MKLNIWIIILSSYRMGSHCCQAESLHLDSSLIVEEKASPQTYYESEFPKDDSYLSLHLPALESAPQTAGIFTHKILKHKFLEKYYQGGWEHNKMTGLGLLYVPNIVFYVGEFNGNPDGKGKADLLQEGIVYEGMLKDGKGEGAGVAFSKDRKYYFDGVWKNSNIVDGTLIISNASNSNINHHNEMNSHSNPSSISNSNENLNHNTKTVLTFHNHPTDPTTIVYPDGRKYVGAVDRRTFSPSGTGEVTFPDESHYSGSWEQGEMHGKGVFTWPDGTFYEGEYQNGKKHGLGKFRFASRHVYEGEWANGKMQGKGTIVDNSGSVIRKGVWKDGVYLKQSD